MKGLMGITVPPTCYKYFFSPQCYADLVGSVFWGHGGQPENYFQLTCQTEINYLGKILLTCLYILYMSLYIIQFSIRKYMFTNICIKETDKFSHSKAKWTDFFINIFINFNSDIKEMKKILPYQLVNYRWWE